MEVRPGYKRTEVGVIPEEWDVRDLSRISTKITDGDHATPQRSKQGYYLLSARNVLNGRIDVSDVDHVGESEYHRMRQRCGPEAGDVLISCSGTIGRICVVPGDLPCVLVRSAALVKLDRGLADGRFIQFWLQGFEAQGQISNSVNQGAQPNLFLNHIERLRCPVPPLPEQRAIAAALSGVDALLGGLDRLIAKKRDLKQATMQQLLTGQTRLPGFSGEWEVRRLGEVLKFQVGCPFSSIFFNEKEQGVRLVKNRDLKSDDQIFHYSGKYDPAFHVSDGDVLIGMDGDFLPCRWSKGPALLNQRVGRIVPLDGLDREFAFYYLIGPLKEIEVATASTTVKHLSHGDIEGIEKPLPSVPEQTAIAAVLCDMDAELAALEARRDKTRDLKQAMMQELLTGKTRLVKPEGAHA